MSRSPLRRSALLTTAVTVALTTAACTGDAEPDPQPTRSPSPSGQPTEEPREVTFGAYGTEAEVAETGTLAVGNPRARPRCSPRVTVPVTE